MPIPIHQLIFSNTSKNSTYFSAALSREIASGFFRISQEALRNISKHARGSAVSVSLSYARDILRLSIPDYGPGFDAADVRYKGLGLISMQERARAIGGRLSIRSVPGVATLLVLKVRTPSVNQQSHSELKAGPES